MYTGEVNLVFLIQKIQLGRPQTWRNWSKVQDQLFGCKIKLTDHGQPKDRKEIHSSIWIALSIPNSIWLVIQW